MKDRAALALKLGISLGLIFLLVRRVEIGEVWLALRGADPALVIVGVAVYVLAIVSNAAKWAVLLRAQEVSAPFVNLLRYTFVGIFANNFLPLVGADVVRGYGLARATTRGAGAVVSVIVDRIVGLIVFTTTGAIAASAAVRWAGVVSGEASGALAPVERVGLVLTGGLVVAFLLLLSGRLRGALERVVHRLPLGGRAVPLLIRLSAAVGAYRRRPRALVAAYAVGLTTILLSNLVNLLFFWALDVTIDPLYVFIFNPIIALLLALPISFAGLGINQNVFPVLYGLAGVAPAPAVAASLLLQLTMALTSLPGGLFWLRARPAVGRPAADTPDPLAARG